jgi:hypothetical protein
MGKRELLLIVGFVILGAVVYQATAPPPAPGERSFSISRILDNVRRELRGNRASAETIATTSYPVDPALTDFRLNLRSGDITITGEARSTIEAELHVRSNGFDQAEAERLAKETVLKVDRAGNSLNASVFYPQAGRQRASIVLRVPTSVRIRLDPSSGQLTITNVAAAEVGGARGDTRITKVPGRVTVTHNGGSLTITDLGSLRLTTRGSDVLVERVKGETTLNVRAGELKAREVEGPLDVESNGSDVSIQKPPGTAGSTVRITAVNGKVSIEGLRTDGRIDSRNADVDVVVDRAAPLAIYSEGNHRVELTPPAGGYQLDAIAADGHITLPEGTLQVTTDDQQQRASGAVGGGGATITVRNSHGDIIVRSRN